MQIVTKLVSQSGTPERKRKRAKLYEKRKEKGASSPTFADLRRSACTLSVLKSRELITQLQWVSGTCDFKTLRTENFQRFGPIWAHIGLKCK